MSMASLCLLVNFEQVSHTALVFLLLTFDKLTPATVSQETLRRSQRNMSTICRGIAKKYQLGLLCGVKKNCAVFRSYSPC